MFSWFKPKPIIEDSGTPYRTAAKVPPMPKEETAEERAVRLDRQEKHRNMSAALALTAFPSAGLLTLGFEWNAVSAAVATTSIFALILMSVGAFIATGIKLEWFGS